MIKYVWNAATGDWATMTDWTPNGTPNADTAEVLINLPGSYTVTIGAADLEYVADSVLLADASAILSISADLTLTGADYLLAVQAGQVVVAGGGTITGGTIDVTGGDFAGQGGTLDGVAFEGTLDLSPNGSELTITGGTTFAGAGGVGPATINLSAVQYGYSDLYVLGTGTLDNATVSIGANNYPQYSNNIVNEDTAGTGAVLTLGSKLTINQSNVYADLLSSDDPGDGIVNEGTINAGFAGGLFTIDATNFTNEGVITVSNGDLIDFTGAPTAALISSVESSTGGVAQIGGTVDGGTITAPDGGVGGAGGTLDGVAFEGTLDLSAANSELTVTGGTTFSGPGGTGAATINITSPYSHSELDVLGTGTLDNATVNIGQYYANTDGNDNDPNGGDTILNRDATGAGAVLTLGPDLTINQTNYYARIDSSDDPGDGIVNEGTINAGFAGGLFTIDATNFTNEGVITVSNGDLIDFTGAPTAALISSVESSTGGVAQIGGTVDGGTITAPDGGVGGAGGTLDGVAFEGTLDLSAANSELTVTGGTTFSGPGGTGAATINITSPYSHSELDVLGTGTLDNATVNIGQYYANTDGNDNDPNGGDTILNRDATGAGAVLTLGPDLTINQTNYYARIDSSDDPGDGIVNEGTINAGFAGGLFTIDATNFTNEGVITVSNGDLIDFTGAPTAALISSVESSTGGVAQIGGTVDGGTITAPDGGVGGAGGTLDGVAFEGTLDLSAANSELTVTGGTTFSGPGGTGAATINITSPYSHSELDVLGTGTLDNATVNIGQYYANTDGNDNDPNGGDTILNRDATGAGAVLTLGPDLTINQTNYYARIDSSDDPGDGIVNEGTINAGFAGGLFTIDATNFTNEGVITVSNGDLIDFTGAPTAALISSVESSTGGVAQIGGTVDGGTITAPDGGVGGAGGTLDGVAFEGTLDLSAANSELTVTGGTTFSGPGGTGAATINITSPYSHSELDVLGTGTLDNATVNIGQYYANTDGNDNDPNGGDTILNRDATGAGAVLTLGPDLTINQTNYYARIDSSDDPGDGIVNEGTINAGFAGGLFTIDATNFTNEGVITVSNGDLIDFTGAPTAALISSVEISTGGVAQIGGTVDGGTITAPDGGVGGAGGTLDGVAFEGTLDLSAANSELTVTGGTTFSGPGGTGAATINITSPYSHSELDVLGTGTLDNATVNIGQYYANTDGNDNDPNGGDTILNRDATGAGAVLTLGPDLTINQTNYYARIDSSDDPGDGIVNEGTIDAGFAGGTLNIDPAVFTNDGMIAAVNGGAVDIEAADFTNVSGETLTAGTYVVGAGSTIDIANTPNIDILNADLTLSGADSVLQTGSTQIEATLTTVDASGALRLLDSRDFTTVNDITDAGLVQLAGGTLTADTLAIQPSGALGGFGVIAGAISGAGLIEANGGNLDLKLGASNTVSLQIDAQATLELGTPTAATVSFAGTDGILKLDDPTDLTGTLAGMVATDAIDFVGATIKKASIVGSAIVIKTSDGASYSYATDALPSDAGLFISSDNAGGSLVTVTTSADAEAEPQINTATPVNFGNVHRDAAATKTLSISNAAVSPAEGLDAQIASVDPGLTASGSFTLLPAGDTDSSSITVGIDTTTPGAKDGNVTLALASDGYGTSGFGTTNLPAETVAVTGAVYALAQAAFSGTTVVLHVGDPGTQTLTVGNASGYSAYSEGLLASIAGASGSGLLSASGSTGLIADGGQDSTSLTYDVQTDAAGTIDGIIQVNLTSDGTGTSGLGETTLAPASVDITATIDNYAVASLVTLSGTGTLTQTAAGYTLNLGQIGAGGGTDTVQLGVENSAAAIADLLEGSFSSASGDAAISLSGFNGFTGLAAGQVDGGLNISLDTSQTGVFEQTITLDPSGTNASGYVGALTPKVLTITGTVVPAPKLAVSDVIAPTDALPGQVVPVSWTLTNEGDAPAIGPWSDEVFLASDAAGDNLQPLGIIAFDGTLAAGQSITRSLNVTLAAGITGNQWVVVETDPLNQLTGDVNSGSREAVAAAPTAVQPAVSPELVVTGITVPTTGFADQQTQISWTVTNEGSGGTSASVWSDNVYLSLDQTLNVSSGFKFGTDTDLLLASVPNPSYLAPGQSYTSTATVTLPQGLSGPYYIIVQADSGQQVSETQRPSPNYTVSSVFPVQEPALPDLQVTSVVTPGQAFSGQTTTLTWTVENTGTGPTTVTSWNDEILVSFDGALDQASTVLATIGHSGALNAGGSYTVSATVTLPIGVSGAATYYVVTDPTDQIYEGALHSNDVGSTTGQINLTPPPDLEAALLSAPVSALAGHTLSLSYQVTNAGSSITPNTAWSDSVYLSSTPTLGSGDTLLGTLTHYGALDVGRSYSVSTSFTVPSGLSGSYYVIVQTNSANQVFELDTINDVAVSGPVTISNQPPDLVVSSVTAPATADSGHEIAVSWAVENAGVGDTAAASWSDSIVLSASGVLGAADNITLASIAAPGALAAGASYTQNAVVSLPLALSGTYTLFVVTDPTGTVPEASLTNNASAGQSLAATQQLADLQVQSVSGPTASSVGDTVTVTWTVDNAGNAATNAATWYDDVYLSPTPTASTSSILLGQIQHSGSLVAGAAYSASGSFTLPANLPLGTYYFVVTADAQNQVTQASYSDDTGQSAAVTVGTEAQPPDLAVSALSVPAETISGQSLTVSYTLTNSGGSTPSGWDDAVYLSRNQALGSSSDIYLGFTAENPLASGASTTVSANFTIPDGQSGPFWIIVAPDVGDVLAGGASTDAVSNEIEVDLPAVADLQVASVTVPATGTLGQDVTITYTVNNLSTADDPGSWYDALYLSADGTWNASDPLIGEVYHTGGVAAGDSYTGTLTALLPGVPPGNYQVVVRTDVRNEDPGTNATGVSSGSLAVTVPTLTLGTPASGTLSTGQDAYYEFTVAAGETVNVSLTSDTAASINNIYVRYGALPTIGSFDATSDSQALANPSAVIQVTQPGTYYVLVTGNSVAGTENYALTAQTVPFSITGITPDYGSNLGSVTVTLTGAQFTANEQVAVVAADGTVVDATQLRWVNSTEVWATFNLQGAATGTYNVQVIDGTQTATLSQAFQVNNGPVGQVSVNLVLPQYVRSGQSGVVQVDYANTGNTDVAAPIIDLSSAQALIDASGSTTGTADVTFLATSSSGPAGMLQPGAEGSESFSFTPIDPTPHEIISFDANLVGSTSATIDWSSLEAALRPATVDATDWNNIWTEFVARVGTTTASLDTALAQEATELSQVGAPTTDIPSLLQYELLQASGGLVGTDLASATDIAATSSSLSLSLGRVYDGTLVGRNEAGSFGDGWTSTYDVTAITDSSGNVYIQSASGTETFTLQADGSFAAATGDNSTLSVVDGLYQLRNSSGDLEQFNANGQLAGLTDANGNTVTLAYGSTNVLQTVTSSTGETITFTSNAAGRITSATDSDGRSVSYTYDTTGNLLLSATGAGGTTTYSYAAATGSVQDNALTSITNPDGTQANFTYDAEGRLASESGANGSGLVSYSYPSPGEVTVTDALGDQTTLLYNTDGEIAQTQDALGNTTQLQYDASGNLIGAVSPGNSTASYSYNSTGSLTGSTDPLGGNITTIYAPGTSNLTSITNQIGSQIQYSYDASGNVTGITYQGGSGTTYQYATNGLLTSSTDADGNTTSYSYDNAGDLTQEAFSDGTSNSYTYDTQGDLLTASTSTGGTMSYTYNSAGRLTSVTNPAGQVESYTYNAGGQLANRTEPDGSVTQYSYNAAGQLSELRDGSGNLLDKYTYDQAGQLIRTDTGNGASTTYQYDADGRTTEILNRNADGTVASRDDYTYNANSQIVTDDTSNGDWTYGYDAAGELTTAVFQSTNASITDQNISYVYDAAGNRVSQTINGVVSNYTTNALNQYTAVGGKIYTYDADGNMTSQTDSSGTTTFTYNDSNQLVSEAGPSGTFQYAYDALGNLVSTTQNGVTTDYVNDPLSLSIAGNTLTSIAQTYASNGAIIATFDYGLGLASVSYNAGMESYFDTNLVGNVTGLSGSDGELSDSYFYSPFGTVTQIAGTSNNPLQFSGVFGAVTLAGSGLSFLRARFYDLSLGRFITTDPIGLSGGSNMYDYASGNPTNFVDPTGTQAVGGNFMGLNTGPGATNQLYDQSLAANAQSAYATQNLASDAAPYLYGALAGGALIGSLYYGTPLLLGGAVEAIGEDYLGGVISGLLPGAPNGTMAGLFGSILSYLPPYTNGGDPGDVLNGLDGLLSLFGGTGGSSSGTGGSSNGTGGSSSGTGGSSSGTGGSSSGTGGSSGGANAQTTTINSTDPNDIVGPAGFGRQDFIAANGRFAYTINFDNAATATAPAQDVTITQQLDPNLDWRTFRLTGFGFDNLTYTLSGSQAFYTAQLDLTATKGYIVDVSAGVNIATGVVTWTFDTIDPATGQTPTNPTTGFLPVNDTANDGDAFVSYTVQAKAGVQTGDVVVALATVVFDNQPPLNTAAISDTFDATAPTSAVQALPTQTNDTQFEVSWSGQDDPAGSGVASYTIYVSVDGGPAMAWLTNTTLTNALYTGVTGHTYAFTSTATDNAGNVEAEHTTPDTAILVGTAAPCFVRGTWIATDHGPVPVETLAIGDRVLTLAGPARPIKWIGRRSYAGRFIAGQHLMLPVCIKSGALGDALPHTDLWVSPGHAMFVDGQLVPAWRLINGVSVVQAVAVEEVTYFHIELDQHEILFANGAAAESFLDDGCRGQFHNAAEFHAVYPEAIPMAPFAARLEDGFGLQRLQDRVADRAGIIPSVEPCGTLRGFIDIAGPHRLCGWAQDSDSPEEPVTLEVRVGDIPVLCLLANAYRADLRHADLGSGCHAFDIALPAELHGVVSVRRVGDGATLQATIAPEQACAAERNRKPA